MEWLKIGQRRYFCLNEPTADCTRMQNKIHGLHREYTFYWQGTTLVKVAEETVKTGETGETGEIYRSYREYDTHLETENREYLLPLTARGKKKKLTPSAVMAIIPMGCDFYCQTGQEGMLVVQNIRNDQKLPIGEPERIRSLRSPEDMEAFLRDYIATCPPDYFEKVERVKNAPARTARYRPGDIFRVEVDRFRYAYGLITGEVRKMEKWPEFPQGAHSLKNLMAVPVFVRFYELLTENPNLTPEELASFSLGRASICCDGDLIHGRHPVVGHKTLAASDLDFPLVCTKFGMENPHLTAFSRDEAMEGAERYRLHVDWGFGVAELDAEDLSRNLRDFFRTYHSPYGGVNRFIFPWNLAEPESRNWPSFRDELQLRGEIRRELFAALGLPEADFDGFNRRFGGLTKAEMTEKLNENGKAPGAAFSFRAQCRKR